MSSKQIISRTRMKGESVYSYCPYCISELTEAGKDYKEYLQPLWILKVMELCRGADGDFREVYDTEFFCDRCKGKPTIDTFRKKYGRNHDGKKYTEADFE